jgi:cobalamin-dependent methionine synthase I
MEKRLICIGELVHASIPATGAMMRRLAESGPGEYVTDSEPLGYMRNLIQSQAADGADYIAVNLDAFGESDPAAAVRMMAEYVELVRRWGRGVPICIDSSNDEVLETALKAWYESSAPVKPPLLNSVKVHTLDRILPLKRRFDFSFVGLLVGDAASAGPGGSYSVDQLCSLAERIFAAAVDTYGFRPDRIFFDSTVFPLAIDMPMEPGVPGYTYRAFETIKAIRTNPRFEGVHFTMGISNCARDLPARKVGICRAYVAKAMEYGLDAVIANPAHRFGEKQPDPELVELVGAYARMDGSAQRLNEAMSLMGEFCQKSRKP